ncbi:hypothetical protein AURDEDRAFT_187308 [Auricularia subglabra TFB-10046 SS5]|uniref:Uncharacterized protein n=1 Tax=Auricularia subglabra (strain TFB-10046 / SS5) TaxID=717982 RepID=J0LIV9_AURST|nr:hypothetical protein AURDEDRAFT_187308 [Auricularia subglabra TFB-10046 SS5]
MATPPSGATPPLAPYNVSLPPFSPLFIYGPEGDTDGWNAAYTGATSPKDGIPSDGIPYRRTQASGSRISLTFEGTGMYLCFNAGGASFALTLDSKLVQTTASAAGQRVCEQSGGEADTLLYASGLEYGSHAALLQVAASADREFRFFGGAVEIGVQTGGKTVDDSLIIDDRDSGWMLVPGRGGGQWDFTTGQRLFNVTGTFECNYGSGISATYKFSGAGGAVLLGDVEFGTSPYSVQLDDGAFVNLDASSTWPDGSTPFFVAGALDPAKEHTITLRNFNSQATSCGPTGFCCISIDAIQLLRAGKDNLPALPQNPGSDGQQDPDPNGQKDPGGDGQQDPGGDGQQDPGGVGQQGPGPESSKKSNAPAIAGGVVGSLAGLAILGAFALFLLRRRRRHAEASYDWRPPMSDDHLARPWVAPPPRPGQGGLTPYTATGSGSGVSAGVGKKQRIQPEPVDRRESLPAAGQSSTPSAAAGGPADASPPPGAPRLAHEDLEQVLAIFGLHMQHPRAKRSWVVPRRTGSISIARDRREETSNVNVARRRDDAANVARERRKVEETKGASGSGGARA